MVRKTCCWVGFCVLVAAACSGNGGAGNGGGAGQAGASGASGTGNPGCAPDCTGRECGPDGCGRSCGSCSAGEVCGLDAICQSDCRIGSEDVNGVCTCEFGMAVVPGCVGCLEDADRNGCPERATPSSGQCRCGTGYAWDLNECTCERIPGPTLGETIGRPCATERDCADVLACHGGVCVCCSAREQGGAWSCNPLTAADAEAVCNNEKQTDTIANLYGPDAITNLGVGCFGLSPNNTYCAPQLQCAYRVEADEVRCGCCTDVGGEFTCSYEAAFALEHCLY